jgi:DNA-binding MarR family transcriptional regulator
MPDRQASLTNPDLAILIAASYRVVTDRLQAAMAAAGLDDMRPAFGYVIRALANEELSVSELARVLDVTKQAASQTVDEMERAGFVERRPSSSDRRVKVLALTAKGRRVRETALRTSAEMEAELAAALGARTVKQARRALVAFVKAHGDVDDLAAQRSRAFW